MTTAIVRGSGGVLFERDVPTSGQALEIWDEQIRKGDLVIITDPVEWVEHEGAKVLRLVAVPEVEAPRRGRPPKVTAEPNDKAADAEGE